MKRHRTLTTLQRFTREHFTPRVFIAATRQNDGKTTASLGLIAALQPHFPRVGYIKPVGQRFVQIEEQKIDEDSCSWTRCIA
jgi:dethiobiotin synthetase